MPYPTEKVGASSDKKSKEMPPESRSKGWKCHDKEVRAKLRRKQKERAKLYRTIKGSARRNGSQTKEEV